MNQKSVKLSIFIFILFFLPAFYGCPGPSTPKITLSVTDCEVDKITVEQVTKITTQGGRQWNLTTTITVKCDGQPVNGAEVKVEFWWPNGTYKLKTNNKGEISRRKSGDGDPPYGSKFKVTIKGNDDDKEVEFEVKRN